MMNYSQTLINQINDECCDVLEEMLQALGVDFQKSHKRLFGCCPVHGGDNPSAWNIYPEGEEVRGYWVCRTRGCEKKWKKNLTGFIHGVLSRQLGKKIEWTKAVEWQVKFLGYKSIKDVKLPSQQDIERRRHNNAMRRWSITPKSTMKTEWTRERVRKSIAVPAQYYLDRGYSRDILDKYDVGFYPAQQRVLIPVYDFDYKYVVGFAGRSVYPQCTCCKMYHEEQGMCPVDPGSQVLAAKWKNSKGFEAAHFLYNYWFSRKSIIETSTIILVEGPGDVWKLEEAGIHNSVALFGVDITPEQQTLLESSWAMNVVILLDNDKAGQAAAIELKKKLGRTHRLYFPTIEGKDIGELHADKITSDILPIIENVTKFHRSLIHD